MAAVATAGLIAPAIASMIRAPWEDDHRGEERDVIRRAPTADLLGSIPPAFAGVMSL